MPEQIKNRVLKKLYNEFKAILYKELNITLHQFLYFFHDDRIESRLLSAFDNGGPRGFKAEFYRKIYAYKFFMMKRAKREKFKPIELLNFIHKEQDKRLILENPPKIEKKFCPRKKKIYIDPNQMCFSFNS